MIPIGNIHPLTDFKRKTAEFRERLKKTGQPEVLTVDGRAEIIIQDAAAYERLMQDRDFADAIRGISEGLADSKAGRVRSFKDFDREFRKRHKIRPPKRS